MKKNCFFIFLLLVLTVNSCKDEEVYILRIDLQGLFENQNVRVTLDDQILHDESIQTNFSTGLASSTQAKKPEGKHTLEILVDETYSKKEVISLKGDLFVGVLYNPDSHEFALSYSDEPFNYD